MDGVKVRVNMRSKLPAVVLLAVFLIASMPAVVANHGGYEQSGTAVVSLAGLDPSAQDGAGFNCDPSHPAQGVGAQVFELDPEHADGDHSFVVDVTDLGTLDIDPVFYGPDAESDCANLGSGGAPLGFLGVDEAGTIPQNATHVKIVYWAGAGDYTILSPNPDDTCSATPFC